MVSMQCEGTVVGQFEFLTYTRSGFVSTNPEPRCVTIQKIQTDPLPEGTLLRKSKVVWAKKFGNLVSKLGGDPLKMRVYRALCNGALLLAWSATAAAQPTQKQAASGATAGAAHAAGVQGEWEGELAVGEARMKLVLHVSGEKGGELRARLDSPEQSVYGMEASAVSQTQGALRFEIAS